MLKIGVTGNIGSGKTTISKVFRALGVPVYLSDEHARKFYQNQDVRMAIELRFGTSIYNGNELNRKELASLIFSNRKNLDFINELIHPMVKLDFEEWASRQDWPYVIMEAAILFENGFNRLVDKTICVVAPFEQRLNRAMVRDSANKELIMQRMNNQLNQEQLAKLCDYVIDNEDKKMVLQRIIQLDSMFKMK